MTHITGATPPEEDAMRTLVAAIFGLILSGCATTWHSDRFPTEELKKAQLEKDTGYCRAVSYGTVPMPPAPQPQQSYNVQGTATGYGVARGADYSFSGTVSPQANFSSGFAQGMALGAMIRAKREREEVFNACMINLGWSNKPPTTQQTAVTQPTSNTSWQHAVGKKEITVACYVEQPGKADPLVIGYYYVNNDARTISTDILGNSQLQIHSWDGQLILAKEATKETYETSPPITKTWLYAIDMEKLTLELTYAWVTSNGLMLNDKQLEAVAKSHPLYLVEKGIVPARGVVQAKCLRMSS